MKYFDGLEVWQNNDGCRLSFKLFVTMINLYKMQSDRE